MVQNNGLGNGPITISVKIEVTPPGEAGPSVAEPNACVMQVNGGMHLIGTGVLANHILMSCGWDDFPTSSRHSRIHSTRS